MGKGPFYEDFYQCVTYGFYTEPWQEQLYTVSTLFLMFILPLGIIVWSYASTFITLARAYSFFLKFLLEISKKRLKLILFLIFTENEKVFQAELDSSGKLFRPNYNRRRLINKAKAKSMRISVVIVITFIICWAPYYSMMLVFMFYEPDEQVEISIFLTPLKNILYAFIN